MKITRARHFGLHRHGKARGSANIAGGMDAGIRAKQEARAEDACASV